jgi:hypothetical protein
MFEWRRQMKNLLFPAALAIVAALTSAPVSAQLRSPTMAPRVTTVPALPPHIGTAVTPLSTQATSPLQQQEQDDYATQLRSAQQQLLMQNPSGVTRPELGVNRALNGFTPQ